MGQKKRKEIKASDVLNWRKATNPILRVRTATDAVPGGLAMAMMPMYVKWQQSSAGFGPDDFYIVQNVNTVNNPVGGTTLLSGLKIYADSVESVEFVIVISKVAKKETEVGGHAMLRFIFREDRRPVMLAGDGQPMANDSGVEDIVISWEAWRPPIASFDPLAGLDPQTYALTPRCLLGSVRCLADAVLDRPWNCYPLELPDVEHSGNELLYVSLAMADAVARQTVTNILDQRLTEGQDMPEGYSDPDLDEWAHLNEACKLSKFPEDPIGDVLEGKIRYHLLERSCITMALTTIDWANRRIHERAELGEPKRVRVSPQELPSFLSSLASGKRTALLLKAPAALHWVMNNSTVIPGKAYELLNEAGLLQQENGKVKKFHYDNRVHSPYGEIADHLIY